MDASQNSIPEGAAVRVTATRDLSGTVCLPGSKSLTNRVLILASLGKGESTLRNVLDCDDSRHLVEALRKLGVPVVWRRAECEITLGGADGPYPVKQGAFYAGNAGTAVRFLTAALAGSGGSYVVDGDTRMRQRPIADLVTALRALGAKVVAPTGCPPVTIEPPALVGGAVDIPGSTSSQFISAILMASPLASRPVEVRVTGNLVSRPYIDLTLRSMLDFGVPVDAFDDAKGQPRFRVPVGRGYRGCDHVIEGDASAASYFYATAAVTGATIRVEGVGKESPQGDARCADIMAAMGCRVKKEREAITVTGPQFPGGFLQGGDWDCSDIPDVVPTLAVVALFARGRTRLRRVEHLRHKESDRIASVATEIRKLGGKVKELRDGLEVEGSIGSRADVLRGAAVDTWGDHRLAMAFSVAALALPDVVIRDARVVSKSFPEFFDVLRSLGVVVEILKHE